MKRIFYRIYVYLFARPMFLRFNRFMLTLGLRGLGIDNYENRKMSGEAFFLQWISRNKFTDTIFDVGANEGDYAYMCKENSVKKIYCFEPVKETFHRLEKRFFNDFQIKCFNLGLSDQPGKSFIYDKVESGSSHATLYPEALQQSEGLTPVEIELDTLDNFCVGNNIKHISLLKIDTEGHEYAVLCGANELIKNEAIDVIQFEFNLHNIFTGHFLNMFRKILPNYHFYRLLPNGFLPITYSKPEMEEFFLFQNIIAIRSEIDTIR